MPINIALDGPAGAGKTSVADQVARTLGVLHLDSGAMYRALGLKALREGIARKEEAAVAALCARTEIDVQVSPDGQRTFLDGEDVSQAIRAPEVGQAASDVSAIPAVRRYMVALQQDYARRLDLIMDGRDIGTHVLPEARAKFFLTADPRERARRRHLELVEKGVAISYEQVLEDLLARDRQDETRAISPLRQAEDARRIDSTDLSPSEVAEIIVRRVREVYP